MAAIGHGDILPGWGAVLRTQTPLRFPAGKEHHGTEEEPGGRRRPGPADDRHDRTGEGRGAHAVNQITALQREAWAAVSKAKPNRPSWNSTDDAPVGRSKRARTTYRSFFRIDLRPIAGATVLQAMLEQPITSAVSCDVDSLEVWVTGDIDQQTSQDKGGLLQKRPSSQAVRATGNFALMICGILLVFEVLVPRSWTALAVLVLAVAGMCARIEAAILSANERDD